MVILNPCVINTRDADLFRIFSKWLFLLIGVKGSSSKNASVSEIILGIFFLVQAIKKIYLLKA